MAVYDSLAKFYDKAFAPLERLGLRRLRKRAFAYLPPYERVLEIGAGTGANFTFYQHSAFALSTELSIEMLRLAKEKQKGNHLVCCNAEALPFADESFDAVAATLVFCSIGKPLQALAEIKRVCRGGKLVLIEHVRPTGLLGSFFDLLSKVTVALIEDHFNRKTAETVEEAGLKIIRREKYLFGIVELLVCEIKPDIEPAAVKAVNTNN